MRRSIAVLAVAASIVVALAAVDERPATGAGEIRSWSTAPMPSWRIDGTGNATVVVGDTVYVGGDFSSVRSPDGSATVARRNLAAFDLNTGALRPGFQADTNGVVRTLVASGGRLFVGGSFTSIRGVSRGRLAAVDLATGAVAPLAADTNSNVYSLALGGGRLYVGGSFTTIKGVSRSRLAALDAGTWALAPYAPNPNGTVLAVAASPSGDRVYAGGTFATVGGVSNPWLVRTDIAGARIATAWAELQGPPLDLEVDPTGTRLAVAQAGAGNQGTWYNAATGARLWRQRCDGDAQTVHIVDGTMVTGFHEACDGDGTQRLAANATADGARDRAFRPTFDRFWGVFAIAGDANRLVIAGDFTSISGVPAGGFAIFPSRTAPTATTTTSPPTTTTLAPTTTTTTTAPATGLLFQDQFTGSNGTAWRNWTTGASAGSATIQANTGRLTVDSTAGAWVRSQLTAAPACTDCQIRLSYQWTGTTAPAYLNIYTRGTGGWSNAYRPRQGTGIELTSNSSTVAVRRVAAGTVTTIRSVTGASPVTTAKHWLILRTSGTTVQFKTWLDGSPEPSTWTSTDTGASPGAGQLYLSLVRGGSATTAAAVSIDDLAITTL